MDKLHILLLDDRPNPFWQRGLSDGSLSPGSVQPVGFLGELCEVSWITGPAEARELIRLIDAISIEHLSHQPLTHFPPEIFVFDYAITQTDNRHNRNTSDVSNPFPRLRRILGGVEERIGQTKIYDGPRPPEGSGTDKYGCFVGGVLARLFSGYPCISIPTTAYADIGATEVQFFEWLNDDYFEGAFDAKTRVKISWPMVIDLTLKEFRQNLIERVRSGEVHLTTSSFDEIGRFHRNNEDTSPRIEIVSRYGRRMIKVAAIFADFAASSGFIPTRHAELDIEVQKFAEELFAAAFSGRATKTVISDSIAAAETYDDASFSELSIARYELSSILADILNLHTERDDSRFLELCRLCDVNPNRLVAGDFSVTPPGALPQLPYTETTIEPRLAVLLLLTRVASRFISQPSREDILYYVDEDEFLDGKILKSDLIRRVGESKARELLNRSRLSYDRSTDEILLSPQRGVTISDVLIGIDPLPQNIFTFENRKTKRRYSRDTSYITNGLKRQCAELSLDGLLRWRRHEQMERPISNSEAQIMRSYAQELGFREENWPVWLR